MGGSACRRTGERKRRTAERNGVWACRRVGTPIGRYADTPIRFSHTPFRLSPSPTLAVFRQERAGICASLLTNLGKDPRPVFVLFKSNLPLEGILLIMSYWTYDSGLRGSASLAAILEFLILAFILLSHLRVVHVLTSLLIATGKSLTDCYCDGLWLCPVACRGKIA